MTSHCWYPLERSYTLINVNPFSCLCVPASRFKYISSVKQHDRSPLVPGTSESVGVSLWCIVILFCKCVIPGVSFAWAGVWFDLLHLDSSQVWLDPFCSDSSQVWPHSRLSFPPREFLRRSLRRRLPNLAHFYLVITLPKIWIWKNPLRMERRPHWTSAIQILASEVQSVLAILYQLLHNFYGFS